MIGPLDHQVVSSGTVAILAIDSTTGGPNEILSTKWPSITSRCSQSAPAFSIRSHSAPRWLKSHASTEGAMIIGLLFIDSSFSLALIMDDLLDFSSDTYFMGEALRQARRAESQDEVPIGAVIVRDAEIIARAWNQVEVLKDATAHAEMLAITQAESVVDDWRLDDCDLYVTKEPCPMCAGAIVQARLRRVIYGCPDPKTGGAGGMINLLQMPPLNHQCLITRGVREMECREVLQRFFRAKREG